MPQILDASLRMLQRLRRVTLLQLFTIGVRYLIGLAFVFAAFAMGKFSTPPADQQSLIYNTEPIQDLSPIGQFFRIMTHSRLYWGFLGAAQVFAGVLLVTQRFAALGAVAFFGIILNIFVLTVGFEFRGTPVVTGLMLLATTHLLVWDLDAFQPLFRRPERCLAIAPPTGWIASPFWGWLGTAMCAVVVGGFALPKLALHGLMAAFGLGLVGMAGFAVVRLRRWRR